MRQAPTHRVKQRLRALVLLLLIPVLAGVFTQGTASANPSAMPSPQPAMVWPTSEAMFSAYAQSGPLFAGCPVAGKRPVRVVDTRKDSNLGVRVGPVSANNSITVPMKGLVHGIDTGVTDIATAVFLNVTVSETVPPPGGGSGFISVFPAGQGNPGNSTVNWTGYNQIQANFVAVGLGEDGAVTLDVPYGSAHVVVDILGYAEASNECAQGTYKPMTPVRIYDSRKAGIGKITGGNTVTFNVTLNSVPADAVAVMLNVTATEADDNGYLTVWPAGEKQPLASNLNAVPGKDVPNQVLVGVGDHGFASFFVSAKMHVIVDQLGYLRGPSEGYHHDGMFVAVDPFRTLDSREATDAITGKDDFIGGGSTIKPALDPFGVIKFASAVQLNATVPAAQANGFLTFYPTTLVSAEVGQLGAAAIPQVSQVNYRPGDVVANAVLAPTNNNVGVSTTVFTMSGVQLLLDVTGFFT